MVDEKNFINNVFRFYKLMKTNDVSLVYEGEITHDITKAFTSLTESAMDKEDESSSTQRKVFHVMVECLQNISKHAEEVDLGRVHKEKRGVFLIHKNQNQYGVTTGNVIARDKVQELKNSLDLINSLDKDGLKKLHKEQIKNGTLSDKQGAGLGFIDIAKKTGNPLEYYFLDIDDNASFFILTSRIERETNK
ncbi:MAG: SiaB family protein kinase [Bacteroidales bacterium]|nr:SiaB family protein kinase [Bacteroidales bacterium]